MASTAQILANRENAQLSTGPVTEAGKQASSQNALALGLFTMRDFVRPDETNEYEALCLSLQAELNPQTTPEQAFVVEIVSATWRLRRCRMLEGELADRSLIDPMAATDADAAIQKSIDRARSQANRLLRGAIAELRRLQTDRTTRAEIFSQGVEPTDTGLTNYKEVVKAVNENDRGRLLARKLRGPVDDGSDIDAFLDSFPQSASFCKTPETAPAVSKASHPTGASR